MGKLERRRLIQSSAVAGASVLAPPARIEGRDGVQLFCRSWGAGRPVVFVHGWAVNCDIWQYQMAALAGQARCIAYDKRGHGRSSDPGRGYDYDSLADDLAAVLETLDLRHVVLVGHSMGPAEIVRYLSRHGGARVDRLVFISSALPIMLKTPDNPGGIAAAVFAERRKQWLRDMPKFLASNARLFVAPETSPEAVSWIAGMGLQASLEALLEINRAVSETDLRSEVSRVRQPTLIVHGDQDKSAAVEQTGKRTAAMIAGSQLRIYQGAPHGLLVTHPEQLSSDLAGWITAPQ